MAVVGALVFHKHILFFFKFYVDCPTAAPACDAQSPRSQHVFGTTQHGHGNKPNEQQHRNHAPTATWSDTPSTSYTPSHAESTLSATVCLQSSTADVTEHAG